VTLQTYKQQKDLQNKLQRLRQNNTDKILYEEGPQMVQLLKENLREWIFQVK